MAPRRLTPLLSVFLLMGFMAISACTSATPGSASKKQEGTKSSAAGANAATVDGSPITLAELDQKVARQIYDARQQALDEMINQTLLEKEAKAQGVSVEDLMKKEVQSKVPEPTPAEIDQVWEANKARMAGRTKEQVAPDIIKWLKDQNAGKVQQTFMQGLRAKYKVDILLDPPRMQVAVDDDPVKGPASAPVTIVEFSDFQCPYCSRVEATVKQVMDKYPGKIRFVYRDFPLSFHNQAVKAAEAAQCANDQGKFWEFHDALYADQTKLSVTDMQATAERLGLDGGKFKSCVETGKHTAEVNKDIADAGKAGVTSTPYFFINGIAVVGAQGLDSFTQVIDKELARAGK